MSNVIASQFPSQDGKVPHATAQPPFILGHKPPETPRFTKREKIFVVVMISATIVATMKIRSEHRQMMRMLDLAQTAILEWDHSSG